MQIEKRTRHAAPRILKIPKRFLDLAELMGILGLKDFIPCATPPSADPHRSIRVLAWPFQIFVSAFTQHPPSFRPPVRPPVLATAFTTKTNF